MVKAATSGSQIFLGTDSALTKSTDKRTSLMRRRYTAHASQCHSTRCFLKKQSFGKLRGHFLLRMEQCFTGLPLNEGRMTLIKEPLEIQSSIPFITMNIIYIILSQEQTQKKNILRRKSSNGYIAEVVITLLPYRFE